MRRRSSTAGSEVIFHIGTHKTGSTALQNFCYDNAPVLRKQGVFYPRILTKWKAHHHLPWSLGIDHPAADPSLSSDELAKAYIDEFLKTGCRVMILSSEDLEFLGEPGKACELMTDFNVKALVYLRRQDDYLVSEYNQHVRMEHTRFTGTIKDYQRLHDLRPRFDYERLLQPWMNVLGAGSLNPRSFEKAKRRPTGVIGDFCAAIGIRWTDEFALPPRESSNISLSPYGTEILRHINSAGIERATRRSIIQLLGHSSTNRALVAALGDPAHPLSTEERLALGRQYEKSNERIVTVYPDLGGSAGLLDWPNTSEPAREPVTTEKLLSIALAAVLEREEHTE